MPIRSASVTPGNPILTAQIVGAWHQQFCTGAFDTSPAQMFQPLTARQRLSVVIDGQPTPFEPSWLAFDGIVLVFHRVHHLNSLTAAFYDLAARRFLPVIAKLTMQERAQLETGRERQAFLRVLIANVRNL